MLHRVLREHLETFLAEARARNDGDGLPMFVERELREFLSCGVLARGFARFRCDAVNFRFDPVELLDRIPLERVRTIHIAGGRWVHAAEASRDGRRWLDDHLHSVPVVVYGCWKR